MKVSYNWLRELVEVDWSPEEMAHRLTLAGTACETVIDLGARFSKMVTGKIESVESIKGADKLKLTQVNVGSEVLEIVCGAPNVAAGQIVPVATVGAVMPDGLTIGRMKKFGVESCGMIASAAELGLSDDHSGIMVFPERTEIGRPLAEALGLDDYTLEFELTPNRADSMSAIGIARDIAALAGKPIRRPTVTVTESAEKSSDYITVEIDDPEFCPRYIGRVIKNVTIGESPDWLKSRLLACGQTPINNVVDITNYVMLEFGQPLHAFDLAHFDTGKVVVRRAEKGKFTTLDEQEREVDESVLMITNGKEDLAAGGVMGGLKSSITETTNDVLLEGANFDPSLIRKSRRVLNLNTDASQRFEKGVDPNITLQATDRATQLLVEIAGGEALSGAVDNYARRIDPIEVSLRVSRMNQILGTDLSAERAVEIFEALELAVIDSSAELIKVSAPTFRPDLEREIDLIEEIARIHGLDNIPTTDGFLAIYAADETAVLNRERSALRDDLHRSLRALGFDEIIGSGLADERLLSALDPELPQARLENPISDEFASMRNSLAYSLLAAAKTNVTHQVMDVRLFEIGNVYGAGIGGEFHEKSRVGALVSGFEERSWRSGKPAVQDFYLLKGALERLSSEVRLADIVLTPENHSCFSQGESFTVSVNDRAIGRLGAIDPAIAKRFDIKQAVWMAEWDLEPYLAAKLPDTRFEPIPRYPSSSRDLAMLVSEETLVGDMVRAINELGGGLVEDVEVFDLFRGKQVGSGQKSVAISIRFRSSEKSLESSEVDGLQEKIIDYLKREFNAEIRDH